MTRLTNLIGCALLLALSPELLHAGTLYKCTDENGTVTFSDVACPATTAEKQEIQTRHSRPSTTSADDYWSVENQVKRMKAERAEEEQEQAIHKLLQDERDRRRQTERVASEHAQGQFSAPTLTYEEALQKALKTTGYREYGRLTSMQKGRVDAEMAKYNYLPPEIDGEEDRVAAEREMVNARQEKERTQREERIRQVEREYEREKRFQEINVIPGREHNYLEAQEDCQRTIGADCD